jgi:probable F420-dependent oxidoreductase
VLVLPYRNPFLVAKAAASLDQLSGGRLILGVAAGYLKGEFAALGVDLAERNDLLDEGIAALRRAWAESGVTLEGRHFHARGNTMLPRPAQTPHPPIWVGGNSRRAIRRAVELGDGWLPFPSPAAAAPHLRTAALENVADLRVALDYAREHADRCSRSEPLEVCLTPFGLDMRSDAQTNLTRLRDGVPELATLGVTWLSLSLPAESRAAFCEQLARVGEELIRATRGDEPR